MAGIPQVITPEKATGALAIDRTTLFNGLDGFEADQLTRTNTAGNRRTFTVSTWLKFTKLTEGKWFGASNNALQIMSGGKFAAYFGQSSSLISTRKLQDPNGWYHCVCTVDTTNDTETERIKLFVNGQRITIFDSTSYPSKDAESSVSDNSQTMYIGISHDSTPQQETGAYMSQYYLIDGLALGPEYFGFTDPLTNTWKPKKYSGTFTGQNSLYLPMDGNTPAGKDQSNYRNRDWTPVNFGGSMELDNPNVSGARPILNTTQGGTQAGVGVFGSKQNVGYAVTVYNDGGGNKYYIDGVKQDTVTGLIRGATYTFDTSDSTVSSHPFRFSATSNGSHGGGSEYTNGVAAITGAATTITVPYNAPNTLYYYCTSHSGMGADITGITTNEKLADQYASKCVLALPLLSNKEDVSTSINCTSSTRAVSASGNAAAAYESSNFYGGSFEFDGTGDYLDVTESDNCFDFGTGDFTIELWALLDNNNDLIGTANNSAFLGSGKSGWVIRRFDEGIKFNYQSSGSWIFENTFGTEASRDKWNHIAITREGNKIRCFSNGVQQGSDYTNTTDITSTEGYCRIGGGYGSTSLLVDGYIQDVRIYKGVAKYTSDFVVPATSPNILPDTPSGVAGGSKLTKVTDGAVTFDGTGDNLEIADNADFEMGTDDFTIECFMYNQEDATQSVVTKYGDNVSNRSFWLGTLTSQRPSFYWYNGSNSYNIDGAAGTLPLNKWSHVVAQRTSGDIYLFVDGKVVASNTGANAAKSFNDLSEPVVIGSDSYSGGNDSPFEGILSNVRIVKGTGVYSTSGFTPPTAPLTNVTNTKLLCCKSNLPDGQGLFEVSPGNITTNGNAASSGFNPFNTDKNSNIGADAVYSTFNPLKEKFLNASGGSVTLTHGNLIVQGNGDSSGSNVAGTLGASSGKYYIEYTVLSGPDSNDTCGFGLRKSLHEGTYNGWNQEYFRGSRIRGTNDNGYYADDTTESFSTITEVGDVLGIAFDIEGNYCQVTRNGHVMASSSSAGLSGYTWYPYFASDGGGKVELNCGQKPFKYAPLDDFKPLNNATVRPLNIFSRADKFVGITTYKGTGVSGIRVETGVNADLIVIKQTNTTRHWGWFDTQRGRGRILYPADDSSDSGTTADIDTLLDDGFTYKTDDRGNGDGGDYLVLSWKAGGGNRSAAADSANVGGFYKDGVDMGTAANAGLGGGTITPSAGSVGTRQGFSIIQYSGVGASRRVPHGLSEAPDLIIVKSKNIQSDWTVYHSSLGRNKYLFLNEPDQASTQSNYWGSADVNSTTFGVENNNTGSNNNNIIAYIWHNVAGLQRFGHYEGNNNADGPFIDLGFTPALIWTKSIDSNSKAWEVHWNQGWRFKENPQSQRLILDDTTDGNAYTNHVDFLSNGFKIRNTFSGMNNATETWIYCAWADVPTIDMYGGGANGR